VTASADVRARRRFDELKAAGQAVTFEDVLDEVKKRDARDMDRADAPLKPAVDAKLIDTSDMSIDEALAVAVAVVEAALKGDRT